MDRAIFDKLAAYWMIPLQSSNEGAIEKVRRQRGKWRARWTQTLRNSMSD
jgi:hypothetical protein